MNRFNRSRKPEQWRDNYVNFTGGLDQSSSPLSVNPGRVAQSLNFEEVFGLQGYRTIKGYERFDGRPSPSAANYAVQPFNTGSIAIVAGETVTNATTATALVVSVTVTSGSFAGGNAAGVLILANLVNTWAATNQIRVSGVQRALATSATEIGSSGYSGHVSALTATRSALRNLIQKPTGSGGILGVGVFNSSVYCVRNNTAGTSATLWRSSSAGWVSIQTGLQPGGAFKFEVSNFSGTSTTLALFGVSGRCRLFKVDSAGVFTKAAPIFGTEGTSVTSNTIGTGARTFTIAQTLRGWIAGETLTIWDSNDSANSMTGTVTSYTTGTNTLILNITSSTGSGTLTAWEMGYANYDDKPFDLAAHKDHMFLACPRGQLQSSNLGDPLTFTTTAALFGIGDSITGIISLKGELLGIFAAQRIKFLAGSTTLDYVMSDHTKDVGAALGTIQENNGNAIFLDDKGLTCLQSTQAFGSFEASILSRNAKTTLDAKRSMVVGSRMAKNNYQHRLYFSDGTCLRCTIRTGNAVITPDDVAFMPSKYDHIPTCFAAGIIGAGNERMFFGTADGYVMEEDAGTSFDGAVIPCVVRPHFNHYKSPNIEKRYHKAVLELDSPDAVAINFRQVFNYDNGTYAHGGTQSADITGTGGLFDAGTFDTFQFDLPAVSQAEASLNGVGVNMTELFFFESSYVRPVTLQGLLTYYSTLGLKR